MQGKYTMHIALDCGEHNSVPVLMSSRAQFTGNSAVALFPSVVVWVCLESGGVQVENFEVSHLLHSVGIYQQHNYVYSSTKS